MQVIYRSSLERQMPTTGSVFRQLFKTIELSEPMFRSVVVLYRKTVRPSPERQNYIICVGEIR